MNAIEAFMINTKIAKFLKENNLDRSHIAKIKYNIKDKNNKYATITLKNGKVKKIFLHDYKLTPQGKLVIAVVASIGITGTLGSFLFKTNKETGDVELTPASIAVVESTYESTEPTPYIASYNETQVSYNKNYNINNFESEVGETENESKHSFLRNISIYGNEEPGIGSYDYVINKYSDSINKYGTRYGIDPAIIAALIMQECGNQKYDNDYQENYYKLGLGQVNCDIFEGHTFNTYNFDTGEYEKYTCHYENLKNNRDEQIKLVSIMLQYYAILYDGNIAAMLISYNQGMGTAGNVIKNVINSTNYETKADVLSADDVTIIRDHNHYTYGDPQYFDKVVTFLNHELLNETFGRNTAFIMLPNQENLVEYSTSVELDNLKGAR